MSEPAESGMSIGTKAIIGLALGLAAGAAIAASRIP